MSAVEKLLVVLSLLLLSEELQAIYDCLGTPAVTGPCKNDLTRWTYDPKLGCVTFSYGGCKGGPNRFKTKAECVASCHPNLIAPHPNLIAPHPLVPNLISSNPNLIASRPLRRNLISANPLVPNLISANPLVPNLISANPLVVAHGDYSDPLVPSVLAPNPLVPSIYAETSACYATPAVAGPCQGSILKWTYSVTKGCTLFTYGGCRGGPNMFETEAECEAHCPIGMDGSKQLMNVMGGPTAAASPDCLAQPGVKGPCSNDLQRFTYDPKLGCVSFSYGGCKGGPNRFLTKAACTSQCHPLDDTHTLTSSNGHDCLATPGVTGPCTRNIESWTYSNKGCVSFIYGGCEGGPNRFSSKAECVSHCHPDVPNLISSNPLVPNLISSNPLVPNLISSNPLVPNLISSNPLVPNVISSNPLIPPLAPLACSAAPGLTGPCNGHQVKWTFDREVGGCITFVYGGCRGGPNKFDTKAECLAACHLADDLPALNAASDYILGGLGW